MRVCHRCSVTQRILIFFSFLLSLWLSPNSSAKAAKDESTVNSNLVDRIPDDDVFMLKNGSKVTLPLKIHSQDYTLLYGTGNINAMNELLNETKEDLIAIPYWKKEDTTEGDEGLVNIYMIHYNKTDIPNNNNGIYNEIVILFLVKAKNPVEINKAKATVADKVGVYVAGIRVNDKMALDYGIEVWGFPKILTQIDYRITDKNFEFKVMNEKKHKQVEFSSLCADCMSLDRTPQPETSFQVVTPYKIRRAWFKAINQGSKAMKAFDASQDHFEYNKDLKLGKLLDKIRFQPKNWEIGKGVQAVFYK